MTREEEKKLAILNFRSGKTKEERAKAFTDYLKKYVQPLTKEKSRLREIYTVFDGQLVLPVNRGMSGDSN